MKEFEKMTRLELANFIVCDQIRRGIINEESRAKVVTRMLKGIGGLKPQNKSELLRVAKAMYEEV